MDTWRAAITLVTVIGVALSVLSCALVFTAVRERESLRFHTSALKHVRAVERAVDSDIEALESVQTAVSFAVSRSSAPVEGAAPAPSVSLAQFRTLAKGVLHHHGGIQALEWSPLIRLDERRRFAAQAQRDYPGFRITERHDPGLRAASRRAEYVPVRYVMPLAGNAQALGFDLRSEPMRREALERARDSGQATATGRIVLVQETRKQFGFLIFAPVYRASSVPADAAGRRARLAGFVVGVYRAGDLLDVALSAIQPQDVDVVLNDDSATVPDFRFLAWRSASGGTAVGDREPPTARDASDAVVERVRLGGRLFSIAVPAPRGRIAVAAAVASMLPLAIGFVFTGLCLVFLVRLRDDEMRRLATLRALEKSESRYRTLAEAMPQMIWTALPDGRFDYMNERWRDYTGLSYGASVAAAWASIVHADDVAVANASWEHAIASGGAHEAEIRLGRARDATYRWMLARAVPMRDEHGRVAKWIGTATDIDDRKRAERSLAFLSDVSTALASSLDVDEILPKIVDLAIAEIADWCAVYLVEDDGSLRPVATAHCDPERLARVRESLARSPIAGGLLPARAVDSGSTIVTDLSAPERLQEALRDPIRRPWIEAIDMRSSITIPLGARGRVLGALSLSWCSNSCRVFSGFDVQLAELFAKRIAVAVDNARLYERERLAAERLQFVADAGKALSRSLDLEATLDTLLGLVVPRLAGWAIINLLDESGVPRAAAVRHSDPQRMPIARHLIGECYLNLDSPCSTPQVFRSRRPQIVERYDDDALVQAAKPEFVEIFRALGQRSIAAIPLTANGDIIGSISLARFDSERPFAQADLPLFEELAHRAATAIGNAKAFERERRVAETLQSASLPISLPRVPRLRFSSVYEPGKTEAQIGGDWYDALRLADGRVVISIGDVGGSGLDAAVTMANMRQVIRGVAHVYPDPAMILDAADKTLRAEGPDRLVSVFVGILDPVTLSLTYASAGHPAPLLRTPDGSFVELPRCGPPLGLRSHDDEAARTIDIPAGSLLVLYTDGLTEATRNIDEGERRLRAAMSDDAILASTDIARAIHDAVLGTGASDDVAILAIDVAAGAESDDDALLRWSFDSHDAVAAQNARHAFSARLRSGLVPEEDICAAELVFGELVGNVARHAPGPTDVVLDWSGPRPVLHVLDTGPGFEHLACLPSDAMSESGRGLFLVSSLAQELHVSRRPKRGSHARAVLAVRRTSRWSTDRAPKPALLGTSLSITALVP